MIIVLLRYTCKDGCREKFYEAIKKNGIDTASKEEEGNVMYEYSYGINVFCNPLLHKIAKYNVGCCRTVL